MAESASQDVDGAELLSRSGAERVLVIATDELAGGDLLGALRRHLDGPQRPDPPGVIVVAPAVEKTPLQHALGDVDTASKEAQRRLDASLAELRDAGISALGEVGDSDPLIAAKDALRQYPADEVLIVAHSDDQARWFEDGLFERAQEELYPPLRLIAIRREDGVGEPRLAEVKGTGAGRKPAAGAERELRLSANMPPLTRGSLLGVAIAIAGTIVVIVLAATGPGADSAGGAIQILVAMAIALINMAHVVGLTLLESVGARGGWQRFFRNLSLIGTPLAIVANALITLLS
jgi:hypothetical protein